MSMLSRLLDKMRPDHEHQAIEWLADFCEEAPAVFYEPVCHVKVKRLSEQAQLPERAHDDDAGWDLRTIHGARIASGASAVFSTGIALAMPTGWCAKAHSRSGMGFKHDVTLSNSVAVIDAGYRGEVKIKLINLGRHPVEIQAGDKIAQLLFERVPQVIMQEVDHLTDSERGTGGFGSSGR